MNDLRSCYDQMKHVIGDSIEPFESVLLVEQFRQYWKPEKVNTILLAESHVFTLDSDRLITLPPIDELPKYPKEYAKFVYCLGYGESSFTNNSSHPKRDGTPQFWKIFFSCTNSVNSNSDFSPVLKSKISYEQRIMNKIKLLKELRQKGIWLVDTSICGLYDAGRKPSNTVMTNALRTSWTSYTKNIVLGAKPERVIVIGKGVAKIVESDLKATFGSKCYVMAQPNAHLSADEHLNNYRTYFRLCSSK